MKRSSIDPFLPIAGVIGLIVLWYAAVWYRVADPVLLPSPTDTFYALWKGMTSGRLGFDFVRTVERTILATLIAAAIAIPLGIFLGASEKLSEQTGQLDGFGPVVILRLRNMTALDATGLHAIETFSDRLAKTGRTLILCGAREQPGRLLKQTEFLDHVGADNIQPHVAGALARAAEVYQGFDGIGEELARGMSQNPV